METVKIRRKTMDMDEDGFEESEKSLFYFESDQLPLRGNADYSLLLRTLATLESQRSYVAKEIDELARLKKCYMENPEEFLKNVKEDSLGIPNSIETAEVSSNNLRMRIFY